MPSSKIVFLAHSLVLLVLYSSIPFSLGATVEYVPNIACSTPSGCDFNSPIWNITGIPSELDDVIISSEVQITIYLNNSQTILHSLTFGTRASHGVTLALYNSLLKITATNRLMHWGNANFSSTLVVHESTWIASVVFFGSELLVTNGSVIVQGIDYVSHAIITDSTCAGNDWVFGSASFLNSAVTLSDFTVSLFSSNDSTLHFLNNFAVNEMANITRGNLTVDSYLFTQGSSVFLTDTPSHIQQISTGSLPNASVSFTSPNSQSTLTAGGPIIFDEYCNECENMDNGELILGDGVTATIIGGSPCHLVVGENVTVNFSGILDLYSGLCDLRQSSSWPTTINIEAYANVFLRARNLISVDVLVQPNGTLSIKDTFLALKGSIHSEGTVHFLDDGSDTTSLFIHGTFTQIGGAVNFSLINSPSEAPIVVNGSIALSLSSFYADVPDGFSANKMVLMQSQSKSISLGDSAFRHQVSGDAHFELKHSKDKIYLERSAFVQFFIHKWYYVEIPVGVVILLVIIVVAIRKFGCKKKTNYTAIN
eukprot:Phypoly_transcript_06728.p1 GENE.Phypoly_transcript_06728~~Phypoly_transcript_06728.p1  ORF type:complete len:538 (+),score=62.32 Phypoly_transcript_06728:124-1737(+)